MIVENIRCEKIYETILAILDQAASNREFFDDHFEWDITGYVYGT